MVKGRMAQSFMPKSRREDPIFPARHLTQASMRQLMKAMRALGKKQTSSETCLQTQYTCPMTFRHNKTFTMCLALQIYCGLSLRQDARAYNLGQENAHSKENLLLTTGRSRQIPTWKGQGATVTPSSCSKGSSMLTKSSKMKFRREGSNFNAKHTPIGICKNTASRKAIVLIRQAGWELTGILLRLCLRVLT